MIIETEFLKENPLILLEKILLRKTLKDVTNILFSDFNKNSLNFKSKVNGNNLDFIITIGNIELTSLNNEKEKLKDKIIKVRKIYDDRTIPRMIIYKKPPYLIVEFTLVAKY